jgi:hypothetical protein
MVLKVDPEQDRVRIAHYRTKVVDNLNIHKRVNAKYTPCIGRERSGWIDRDTVLDSITLTPFRRMHQSTKRDLQALIELRKPGSFSIRMKVPVHNIPRGADKHEIAAAFGCTLQACEDGGMRVMLTEDKYKGDTVPLFGFWKRAAPPGVRNEITGVLLNNLGLFLSVSKECPWRYVRNVEQCREANGGGDEEFNANCHIVVGQGDMFDQFKVCLGFEDDVQASPEQPVEMLCSYVCNWNIVKTTSPKEGDAGEDEEQKGDVGIEGDAKRIRLAE